MGVILKRLYLIISILIISLSNLFSVDEDWYNTFAVWNGESEEGGLNSFLTIEVPPGGKYEGMGTAYTGVIDDIGFLNDNPSVSSRLNLSEISFFHNNFIADVDMETIAFTRRFNDLGIGFQGKWLHVGFTKVNDWAERDGKGIYSEFILNNNISYNLFRGFDFSGISVGANINMGYRSVPEDIYKDIIEKDQSAFAIFGDLGMLTEFNFLKFYSSRGRNFSIGLSLKNIGKEFIEIADPLPSSANGGIAYAPIEPLTLSYDISYRFNLNPETFEYEQGEGLYHAFGFDLNIIDTASIHGGFLNKTGGNRFSLGTEISYRKAHGEYATNEREFREADNIYVFVFNYSLDITHSSDILNRFSVELKLNLGDQKRLETREKVQELYVKGLKEYSEGNIKEAIAIWEKCIKMDNTYDPAIRMKSLAEQSIELEEKIKESQSVE